ncbi:MAG: thioredoxin domain-containing protein [Pseudomonadota bacterium]
MNLLNTGLVLVGGVAIGFFSSKLVPTKPFNVAMCYKEGAAPDNSGIFSLDEKTYSLSDLPLSSQQEVLQTNQSSYDQNLRALEQVALRLSIAKEKKIPVSGSQIPTFEELFKDDWVKEDDVKQFYEKNKKSFPATASLETMGPSIKRHLELIQVQTLSRTKLKELKDAGKFQTLLRPPCGPKIEFDSTNQPTITSKVKINNNLTLISDFSCPQCRGAYLGLSSVWDQLSENANIVHIAYAQDEASLGFALAKGAVCAAKQGEEKSQSWFRAAYLASMKATSNGPNTKTLVEGAISDSSLDKGVFDSCFESPETSEIIRKNNKLAKEYNIADRMAVFLNKRLVVSTIPDEILELTKRAR